MGETLKPNAELRVQVHGQGDGEVKILIIDAGPEPLTPGEQAWLLSRAALRQVETLQGWTVIRRAPGSS